MLRVNSGFATARVAYTRLRDWRKGHCKRVQLGSKGKVGVRLCVKVRDQVGRAFVQQ